MSENIQNIEYLYTQFVDHDGQMPSHWNPHPILKRTEKLIFVQFTIGRWHKNMRLNRSELEEKGEIYWSHGTWIECFYTEAKKNRIDELYKSNIPECLKFLGLPRDATREDVKRAYKQLARQHHPDAGGSNVAFQHLQDQYDSALRLARL